MLQLCLLGMNISSDASIKIHSFLKKCHTYLKCATTVWQFVKRLVDLITNCGQNRIEHEWTATSVVVSWSINGLICTLGFAPLEVSPRVMHRACTNLIIYIKTYRVFLTQWIQYNHQNTHIIHPIAYRLFTGLYLRFKICFLCNVFCHWLRPRLAK